MVTQTLIGWQSGTTYISIMSITAEQAATITDSNTFCHFFVVNLKQIMMPFFCFILFFLFYLFIYLFIFAFPSTFFIQF